MRLAAEGAEVWIGDLALKAQNAIEGQGAMQAVDLDVTDEASVARAIEHIMARGAGPDVVVNCAGIALEATAQETSRAAWQRVIDVNLTGTFLVCRQCAAVNASRAARGAIVNIASDAALAGQRAQAAYCASKGGVAQFHPCGLPRRGAVRRAHQLRVPVLRRHSAPGFLGRTERRSGAGPGGSGIDAAHETDRPAGGGRGSRRLSGIGRSQLRHRHRAARRRRRNDSLMNEPEKKRELDI